MTAAVVDTTLGERLSPSQVNTFLSCPAKWYFRYALGLVEPRKSPYLVCAGCRTWLPTTRALARVIVDLELDRKRGHPEE